MTKIIGYPNKAQEGIKNWIKQSWIKIDPSKMQHKHRYLVYEDNKGGIICDYESHIDEHGNLTWLDPDFKHNVVDCVDNLTHYMEHPTKPH